MRSPNAVVEPVVANIRLSTSSGGGVHQVGVVLHCHVRLADARAASDPAQMTIEQPISVDPELQAQIELMFSMLRRRVGLDYGEA